MSRFQTIIIISECLYLFFVKRFDPQSDDGVKHCIIFFIILLLLCL